MLCIIIMHIICTHNEQFLHGYRVCQSFKFSLNLFCIIYIHILSLVLLVSVARL